MKKAIHALLTLIITTAFMFALPDAAKAAETGDTAMPVLADIKTEDAPGIRYMIKTYEAAPGQDPDFSLMAEEPFEHEGLFYTFQYASANEVTQSEKKWERAEVSFPVDSDDIQAVFQRLEPSMPYGGDDGFTGRLDLDYTAVWTEVSGYRQKSFTLKDTATLAGLSSNDTSNIPKTREKSGVTLTLENVDWSVQESAAVGYDTVPVKYTATAHYAGSYTKQVPSGYLARAWYGGEVEKTSVAKVLCSVTYAAELPPEAVPEPGTEAATEAELTAETSGASAATDAEEAVLHEKPDADAVSEPGQEAASIIGPSAESGLETEPETEPETEAVSENADKAANEEAGKLPSNNDNWLFPLLSAVAVLGFAAAAWRIRWQNVSVCIGDGVEGYKRIAKRHINTANPVVDLSGLKLPGGRRLSIDISESAVTKLKGKAIRTVIRKDYSAETLVKTKHKNFRYVVNIPAGDAGGSRESGS